MNSNSRKGSDFEISVQKFYDWLFAEMGLNVLRSRRAKSGSQGGHDIEFVIERNNSQHHIYIECKNYQSDLAFGNIFSKAFDLDVNYTPNATDLFIAINPNSNFSNDRNFKKIGNSIDARYDFKYLFLDLSSGVKELFSLNPTIYQEIYSSQPTIKPDKDKALRRFSGQLFSQKPFQKIHLTDPDRQTYLGIKNTPINYIKRYVTIIQTLDNDYLNNENDELELKELLEQDNFIILIGNPGIGKSTELHSLAETLWHEGEQIEKTPIFIDLKSFNSNKKIGDFLPNCFEHLPCPIIIMDGIDEITDLAHFKSELNYFMQHSENVRFKIIVSCRTNIYHSFLNNIPNFKLVQLKDLNIHESCKLIQNLTNKIISPYDKKFAEFLKNPFQLNLLITFLKEKNTEVINLFNLWETYINNRLNNDKQNKLNPTNLTSLKSCSKRLALINELMHQSSINEELIRRDVKCDLHFNELVKSPILEKLLNDERWSLV
jgi:energy-coupling factor transporter ATP-binding protein EcfA2